eukprot:1471447-Prymnesium_polylepis.1
MAAVRIVAWDTPWVRANGLDRCGRHTAAARRLFGGARHRRRSLVARAQSLPHSRRAPPTAPARIRRWLPDSSAGQACARPGCQACARPERGGRRSAAPASCAKDGRAADLVEISYLGEISDLIEISDLSDI